MENVKLEIFKVFAKLGIFAFGGPAAHVAMMEDEIVTKRKWMSKERFIDMYGFTSLIPGPNSTEMAILMGYHRGGMIGLIIAGLSFILPAVIIVLALAVFYVNYGTLPFVSGLFDGVKPVILAIVLQALYRLSKSVLSSFEKILIFIAVLALSFFGFSEIPLILIGASIYFIIKKMPKNKTFVVEPMSWFLVFLVFLKIGSVLYGSGYVLLSFLETEFVLRYGAITSQTLLDAVAVGQFTPGPVFTTATFVGYVIAGFPGAIAATIGIFLPSFLLVGLVFPWFEKLRKNPILSIVLDGVNVASIALMAAVTVKLGIATLIGWQSIIIFLVSAVLLIKTKINSTWLILAGSIIGILL
ncbi:MAG: chromate transporter [Erysipelotrichaceae bacterium]|nr:chromate transporter [Erysipelotrichaceae bacterium]